MGATGENWPILGLDDHTWLYSIDHSVYLKKITRNIMTFKALKGDHILATLGVEEALSLRCEIGLQSHT